MVLFSAKTEFNQILKNNKISVLNLRNDETKVFITEFLHKNFEETKQTMLRTCQIVYEQLVGVLILEKYISDDNISL